MTNTTPHLASHLVQFYIDDAELGDAITTPPNAQDIKTRLRRITTTTNIWDVMHTATEAADHIESLERQLADANKDAMRYRWLISYGKASGWDNESIDRQIAIDTALKDRA